jgi:hypothetical protein
MKNIILILSLFIGSAAQAEFKVGDNAVYASVTRGFAFDMVYEVMAVDAANDKISINQSIVYNGSVVSQTSEEGTLSEAETDLQVFDACLQLPAELNPRYETITVPAGTFNTCHLTSTDSAGVVVNGFFANISFGIIKMTKEGSSDDSDMTMELKSFKKN